MSELINKPSLRMGEIFKYSFSFIFKNLHWIVFFSLVINIPTIIDWLEKMFYGQQNLVMLMISSIASFILAPLFAATVAVILGERFLGRQISFYQGLKKSFGKWFSLILLSLLTFLAVSGGLLMFIIPGLIVICAAICSLPAMMLENLKPMAAFKRSWALTKNNRLRVFGYILVMSSMFASTAILIMLLLLSQLMNPLYVVGILMIIVPIFHALSPAVATLLFIDLRNQKELADLENVKKTELIVPNEIE